MTCELNILTIDEKIRNELTSINSDRIKTLSDRLNSVISNPKNIDNSQLKQLKNEYDRLQTSSSKLKQNLNFYVSETLGMTEQYKNILKIPKQINFMGKSIDPNNETKNKLILDYMKIASKYTTVENFKIQRNVKCSNCSHILEYDIIEDNTQICNMCASEQAMFSQFSSYTDSTRVNISSKYLYDRKTHFRECIAQYHGKQNITIPVKVYDDLDKQFVFHGLLIGDEKTSKSEKYANVTRKTVMTFLKELGYPKQYENLNLIHSVITDTKLDDIDYLNEQILLDFDILSELYDKRSNDTTRKNFINTQYVLFQLLRRHGHSCDKEDFTNLKTVDRKFFHENIIKNLFEELKWNYTSIF
jgi:hypothetical protein